MIIVTEENVADGVSTVESVHPATMPLCLEFQIRAPLNARTDALRRIETMHHDECSSLSCHHLDSSWFASTQPRIVPSNRIYPRLIDCRRMDPASPKAQSHPFCEAAGRV